MRRRLSPIAAIVLALITISGGQASLPTLLGYREGQPLEVERQVAPGITHRLISRTEGPYTINVATIDLGRDDLVIEAEKGKDNLHSQEAVTTMVQRLRDPAARPIVAINGDFWGQRAVPINMFVDEGMIWRMPWKNGYGHTRAIFAFNGEEIFLGRPKFEFTVTPTGGDAAQLLRIDNLNGDPGEATVTAYNAAYGKETPKLQDAHHQIVIKLEGPGPLPNQQVSGTIVSTDTRTPVTLDSTTLVLRAAGAPPSWANAGSTVTVKATLEGIKGPVEGVVGGGPTLVRGGEVVAEEASNQEGFGDGGMRDRHPRTAIGIKADGKTIVMLVVDGRQPRRSVGMTFPELAQAMKEMGCVEAMNLDGGGSSTMVIGNELANFPSDSGGARPVSNALVVRRTAPLGKPSKLVATPANPVVPVGGVLPLSIAALDDAGEQVPLEGWKVNPLLSSAKPQAIEDFRLPVDRAGLHEIDLVLFAPNGESKAMKLPVVGVVPKSIVAKPTALLLAKGDVSQISFDFESPTDQHFSAGVQPRVTKLPKFLAWEETGTSIRARSKGAGYIQATIGDKTARIPVAVDRFSTTIVDTFDAAPTFVYTHTKTESSSPAPTVDTTTVKEGKGAWRVDYKMLRGGTSKLSLPIKATLPGEPLAVGLWVYGDGNEHWLRGVLSDADGDRYYLDFTSSLAGVNWKDQWKLLTATVVNPTVLKASKPTPKAPLTLTEIYLVQPQEAAKKDGTLLLDGLSALGLPEMK
jgi:hypothetical protein